MKGLRRFIAPFAPDQSGAAAVLCELGGMVIILDAGGCAGNICGFDEPRWFGSRSAIFSAGLRDMDAILGRDDLLVQKVDKAARRIRAKFIALIGTPVPAVIATDYRALRRMIGKKTGLPVLTIDSNGTGLYDAGQEKAWMELVRTFVKEGGKKEGTDSPCRIGVFGLTPLDLGGETGAQESSFAGRVMEELAGHEEIPISDSTNINRIIGSIRCYGMGASLEDLQEAGYNSLNIAASPSGLAAVRYLEKKWATPFISWCPPDLTAEGKDLAGKSMEDLNARRILIIHQQILGNSIREMIEGKTKADAPVSITAASWFSMDDDLKREGDVLIREEDQWQDLVREGAYDLIIGDPLLARALPEYKGKWLPLSHFAVSGKRINV